MIQKILLVVMALLSCSEAIYAMGDRPVRNERVIELTPGDDNIEIWFGESRESTNADHIVFINRQNRQILTDATTHQPLRIPFWDCTSGGITFRILGLGGNDHIKIMDELIYFPNAPASRDRGLTQGCRFIVDGGDGSDVIQGSQTADIIYGGAGNDSIDGGGGADEIYGNEGNDRIWGFLQDRLEPISIDSQCRDVASSESDTIYGGSGDDVIHGQCGDDIVAGEDGDDELWGDSDIDILLGGNGRDFLNDRGSPEYLARNNSDELHGGAGNDLLCDMEYGHELVGASTQFYGDEGDDIIGVNSGINSHSALNSVERICTGSSYTYQRSGPIALCRRALQRCDTFF